MQLLFKFMLQDCLLNFDFVSNEKVQGFILNLIDSLLFAKNEGLIVLVEVLLIFEI